MNLENIGKDCPCYEVDCSDIMFDIGEFCGLPPNNGKLTIQVNGSMVGDFSANQQEDETINITTPTSQDIANAVAGEALLREQADNTLQSNINAEELARQRADRDIQAVLDGESLARANEDRNLQSQIDAIASKSDVVDVVGTYAELQAYDTSKLNDNDVIKVLDDSTHNDSMTYYRWNKTTQTWSYIGQESPYYSKSQMDTLLATKQDNLTAGTGITLNGSTISADTTVLAEKSELDNYAEKANTYTKTEVDNLVEPKLSVEVVEQLPVQGEESKLYLTPKTYTTGSATGNPITISLDEDEGKLSDFQLDGDTFQQSYTGKNLFNIDNYSSAVLRGGGSAISVAKENATTLKLTNLISQGSNFCGIPIPNSDNLLGKSVTISGTVELGTGVGDARVAVYAGTSTSVGTSVVSTTLSASGSFTLAASIPASYPSGADRIHCVIYSSGNSSPTVGSTVLYSNLQLEVGSATDYEPYTGGIASPNPTYPQPIQVVTGTQTVSKVGKNLFNKNNPNIYHYSPATQGQALQPLAGANTVFVKIQPNTDITVSSTDRSKLDTFASVVFISGEPESATTWITRTTFGNNDSVSVTSPANATYIGVYAVYSSTQATINAALATIQIEYGSSATAYTPYSKTDYTIDLGSIELCKLGTYQDYIYKDGDDWKVHKEVARNTGSPEVVGISSTLNSGPNVASYTGAFAVFNVNLSGLATARMSENIGVYQSQTLAGNADANAMIDGTFCQRSTNDRVYFRNTGYIGKTGAEVRQMMITNSGGIKIMYYLTTPTDTEITDATLISQLNAIASASLQASNTITNTATGTNLAGDMEVDYYEYDPTNRYDKWLWLDINNAYEKLGS